MTDPKKDAIDSFIDFIISDDTELQPEDQQHLDTFNAAEATANRKLAAARLNRARAGVAAVGNATGTILDLESARRILARAKAGDTTAQVTLAARFGDGAMDGDMDAILEDLAELEAENREED